MQKHRGIWLALLLALLAAAVLAPVAAMASEPQGIPIDTVHFPDATFRQYVKVNFDTNNDNVLSSDEIAGVTQIDVQRLGISNLTGIKYFTALTSLHCYNNQLTSLDVSDCTALTYLDCSDNRLTSLDVSKNTELGWLNCSGNRLTSLDLSQNTKLNQLYCSDNQLTSLDVSKNTELGWLYCSANQLTSLDVSKKTELRVLDCSPQTARLGVNRSADGTWSANLAALVTGWTDKAASITKDPEEVWDEATNTVTWRDSGVQPIVTYDYDTGYVKNNDPVKMNVTLTLVPLGVGTGADVTGATVKNIAGVISGTEITVKLPAGSPLPTAGDIAVTLSPYATMTNPATADGGHTWTFTVTSEDEQTVKNYTLYIVYGVTVESGEDDHGTVTASPNPARMGDTVTLTVTPDPGYMLTGWEVVLGDVTVREDNTFVMPSGAVILRPIFAPIPATPPQTGDDSHTGLWLALLLASLGGLCAAAYAARRRRGGAREAPAPLPKTTAPMPGHHPAWALRVACGGQPPRPSYSLSSYPSVRRSSGRLRQSSRTLTHSCKFTRMPSRPSMSCRASWPMRRSIAPCLPMMMPLCAARSQ